MLETLRELLRVPPETEILSAPQIVITLMLSTLCALVIFLVYRFFNKGVVYSANYNLLILLVCVVTTIIIIAIGSNLALSLGMVGALSIVRFRAAVKDPLDVGFIFWSVAAGLTVGARLYLLAIIGTIFIAILYIIMSKLKIERKRFLLVIRYAPESEEALSARLNLLKSKLKNKTLTSDYTEITLEIKIINNDTSFLESLRELDHVSCVTLVEYTGDYA